MKTLKEFKEAMKSGAITGGSSLAMRNEDIQHKNRIPTYPLLKREKQKMSKLLAVKELAFDFDPTTGEQAAPGEVGYNAGHKFRPAMSATSLALLVKQLANEVPKTKERLADRAGIKVDDWDTSDISKLTETDKEVFKYYSYPQIFTLPVINVKLDGLSTKAWGRNYLVDIKRDENNKVIGDTPLPLLANYFYSSIAQEECQKLENAVNKGEQDLTKDQLSEKKRSIRQGRVKVSSDYPVNYLRIVELPLNDDYTIDQKYVPEKLTKEKVTDQICLTKLSQELSETLTKLRSGAWKAKDTYFDFYEVDMVCPTDIDDPGQLSLKTRYEKADAPLKDLAGFDSFMNAYVDAVDEEGDVERKVWASSRVTKYDENVELKLLQALEEDIDLTSEYVTEKVITGNKNFIQKVFAEAGDEIILAAEGGFSGKEEGTANVEEAVAEAKESYDVTQIIEQSDYELEDMNLDTISEDLLS